MRIICVGWKLSMEENTTLSNIAAFIEKKIEGAEVTTTDAYRHSFIMADHHIAFGTQAYNITEDKPWYMPSVKDLKKNRDEAMATLNEIIYQINERAKEKPVEQKTYVETKEGITVGQEACDINITEQEAEYIKTLRSLLDGSKIVILKGDLRIEVE